MDINLRGNNAYLDHGIVMWTFHIAFVFILMTNWQFVLALILSFCCQTYWFPRISGILGTTSFFLFQAEVTLDNFGDPLSYMKCSHNNSMIKTVNESNKCMCFIDVLWKYNILLIIRHNNNITRIRNSCCSIFSFLCSTLLTIVCPFVLFHLEIILHVLLRLTDSAYPFSIFKVVLLPILTWRRTFVFVSKMSIDYILFPFKM
jgi:hypothetical protein